MIALAARPSCAACRRPIVVCFCDRRTILTTRTRVLLFQHPRESEVGIGTARMAHLALPNSRLTVGMEISGDAELQGAALRQEAYVLFPGADAIAVETLPEDRPITLVVLDGTWWQARKLLRLNPTVASLPRIGFHPRRPSDYAIRREPAPFCVSTIEALAHVLAVIEPEGSRFARLLDPFHAMVARQLWFRDTVGSSRHGTSRKRDRVSPRSALAARLSADWSRLVCVHGEANSWPREHPTQQDPETVQWVAHRPATGQTFEAVVAPRRPLSPSTPAHVELTVTRLRAGGTLADWRAAWSRFTRPHDILVVWGTFYRNLAAAEGLPLASSTIDLRDEAAKALRRRVGSLDTCSELFGTLPERLGCDGRGGRRLDALVDALAFFRLASPKDTP